MIIYDAENAIVGRLGSHIAKDLLNGEDVVVINSEKAILSGNADERVNKIEQWRRKGLNSQKGPKVSKLPDRLLKRMIRGMLPWDKPRGRVAYKKLKCYVGNGLLKEEELKKAKKIETKIPLKYVTIKRICKLLG